MKSKRLAALLLSAAMLMGLAVLPVSAAEPAESAFDDIADPTVAEAAEVLRVLGVVDGTGVKQFNPEGTLTRAEFCKMVIEIMGKGKEEPAHRNRTIFMDVKPNHWARGYINLAASTPVGESGEGQAPVMLVMGAGDGNFYPGRSIAFGEAATILLRVLGYKNSDVATGGHWYDGYVAVARSGGLADGIDLGGSDLLTRGQAAELFFNLLLTSPKDSKEIYLTSLGGQKKDGGILLDTDAVAEDGTHGAVQTTNEIFKTERAALPVELEGLRGDVLLDRQGKLLAFYPDSSMTRHRTIIVGRAGANYVTVSGGEQLAVKPETRVYINSNENKFESVWTDLRPGTAVDFCYDADGKLNYLFFPGRGSEAEIMVLRREPAERYPFGALTAGHMNYKMIKNGLPAGEDDIRKYDVATYDRTSNTLYISDRRLTGAYENVSPNPETPMTIKVMGKEFDVLPEAIADLQNYKIGDVITLLFTYDGKVAGVVSSDKAKSNVIGVVEEIQEGGQATVALLNGPMDMKLSGACGLNTYQANQMTGQPVTVSSYKKGQITLTRLKGSTKSADLDLISNKLGTAVLADNIHFFERVGTGRPHEISRDQITVGKVPASAIELVYKDYAGRVELIMLNDVTGDQYTYGKIKKSVQETETELGPIANDVVHIENSGLKNVEKWENEVIGSVHIKGSYGGVAPSIDKIDNLPRIAGVMPLNEVRNIARSAVNTEKMTVTTADMELPISGYVSCYNETTGVWFGEATGAKTPEEALNQARAYSDDLTVYYDRTPETGGKVRIVVVK